MSTLGVNHEQERRAAVDLAIAAGVTGADAVISAAEKLRAYITAGTVPEPRLRQTRDIKAPF